MSKTTRLDNEHARGYADGRDGRPRAPSLDTGAANLFLAGFFGSRFEDEVVDAYERGYREGAAARAERPVAVHG